MAVGPVPADAWARWLNVFRSVSRIRVELLSHELADPFEDALAGSLADLEARLASESPVRWRLVLPSLEAEERRWWHSPGRAYASCRLCGRLTRGIPKELLAALPVPSQREAP
jgi:hypothetical protein